MFASKDIFLTPPSGAYTIARSVRLRNSATAYFSRTNSSSPTNAKIGTLSMWVKRGSLDTGNSQYLIMSGTGTSNNTNFTFFYQTDNTFAAGQYSETPFTNTAVVFRDPSAWYHLVITYDSTQATASNRFKLYVNNQLLTSSTTITQNNEWAILQSGQEIDIGRHTGVGRTFDGYLTEINLIDGQALTPSSFGTTNATTGVWQPAKYTGTYGTNGFYLNFSDNSNNTAATIGKDYSGNGNNWTPNNISVTAGVTYDSMVDSPTVGATSSNYCVWNPLSGTTGTVSEGNLYFVGASSYGSRLGTIALPTSTKIYFEATLTVAPYTPRGSTSAYNWLGVALSTNFNITSTPATNQVNGLMVGDNGYLNNFASSASDTGTTFVINDIIGFAIDTGANTYTIYRNNSSIASGTIGVTAGTSISPMQISYSADGGAPKINFGQRPFSYTPPTGFAALNTYNLPASTITNGAAYMNAVARSGTGATATVAIAFEPDFIWSKCRSNAVDNLLFDDVRGLSSVLFSNLTLAEDTSNVYAVTTSSSGYGFGSNNGINGSGRTYVDWVWKAGGTSASNTNGSITSTVSVGATQGFSVVTYTGTGVTATIGHGLGVAPSMVIVKNRSAVESWRVGHSFMNGGSSPWNYYMNLNGTAAQAASSSVWNNTAPTSTVFSISNDSAVSGSGNALVAYCFAPVAGYSAFGYYTGNGSTDGPFIYTGFRPRWIMIKQSSASGEDWTIYDSSRNTYNSTNSVLYADTSSAEFTSNSYVPIDLLSNGFKIRTDGAGRNASSATYIYACFAENPFRNALAR